MKELTIKQKAKAYDEAIKRGLDYIKHTPATEMVTRQDIFEAIFPELKESEDEKIKNKLINLIKMSSEVGGLALHKWEADEMLTWVEKQGEQKTIDNLTPQEAMDIAVAKHFEQGEQKSADKVEPKFKVGDEIKTANEESLIITKIDEKGYWSEDLFICGFNEECIWDLVEQKPAWSKEDEEKLLCICEWIKNYPRIADFKDEMYTVKTMYTVANNYINWLKSLKERVQPKQEWSEEDEKKRNLLISILKVNHPNDYFKVNPANTLNMEAIHTQELVDWLKSLRPQNRWKPSDEQMENLSRAFNGATFQTGLLMDLYQELKKLREE